MIRNVRNLSTMLIAGAALPLFLSGCEVEVAVGEPLAAGFVLTCPTVDVNDPTNTRLDCLALGADKVEVSAFNLDTGDEFIDLFDCENEAGVTDVVTAGDYDIQISLNDAAGNPLSGPISFLN